MSQATDQDDLERQLNEMPQRLTLYTGSVLYGVFAWSLVFGWSLRHYGFKKTFALLVAGAFGASCVLGYGSMEYLSDDTETPTRADA